MEIELHALGHSKPGEPETFWVEAKGTHLHSLKTLLAHFWAAAQPVGADGPAVSVRFADAAGAKAGM